MAVLALSVLHCRRLEWSSAIGIGAGCLNVAPRHDCDSVKRRRQVRGTEVDIRPCEVLGDGGRVLHFPTSVHVKGAEEEEL